MELSPAQGDLIVAQCQPASWQALAPWLLRHTGSADVPPSELLNWLLQAPDEARARVLDLLRHMESGPWTVEAAKRPESAPGAHAALTVRCGSWRWTLRVQRAPHLRVVRVER